MDSGAKSELSGFMKVLVINEIWGMSVCSMIKKAMQKSCLIAIGSKSIFFLRWHRLLTKFAAPPLLCVSVTFCRPNECRELI